MLVKHSISHPVSFSIVGAIRASISGAKSAALAAALVPALISPAVWTTGCTDQGTDGRANGALNEGAEADPIVARIGSEAVRRSEVERRAAWRLHRARVDVHRLLEQATEEIVTERLLERHARENGVEVDRLLQNAEAGVAPVTEDDIDRYLEEHPSDVGMQQARPRVRHYLTETRRLERRLALVDRLRAEAGVEMLLAAPERPRSELDLDGAPARGAERAAVTVVYFGDLSRAESARVGRSLARLEAAMPGEIRIVFRSLPVERDELGLLTAQLLAAAQQRDAFWPTYDRLVAANGIDDPQELWAIAAETGLDALHPGLAGDLASLQRVRRDLAHAQQAGVRRAPTLFVNGRYLMGLGDEGGLRDLIIEEAKAVKAAAKAE